MNKNVERDFSSDENYKRLKAKQVYLFALNLVRRENTWDIATSDDIAYDLTMDAIAGLLAQEKSGKTIENKYGYLCSSIKNALQKPKLIFYKSVARSKIDSTSPIYYLAQESLNNTYKIAVDATLVAMDMHKMYEFIVHDNNLTDREKQVSQLLNEGYSGKEIAQKLNTSESTITRIVASIRVKMRNSGQ